MRPPTPSAISLPGRLGGASGLRIRGLVTARVAAVLGVTVLVRLLAIALIHPPIVSDWARYEALAEQIARSGPTFADIPTGLPMILGSLYAVFGVHPVIPELVNLAAALGTTWLVYRMAGMVPALLFAVLPEQVLMTTLPASEPLYAFAMTLVVYLATYHRGWLLTGMVVGLSQYVRSSAEVVVAGLSFAAGRRLPVLLLGAAIALSPVIAWNAANGRLSDSTSAYLGTQLLIGSNQATSGRTNDADLAVADPWPVALSRITADPAAYVGLALRKMEQTWTETDYAAYWTIGPPWYGPLALLSALGLLAVFACVLVGFRSNLAALGLLFAFTLAFGIIESQGRYHFALEPVLLVLAGNLRRAEAVDGHAVGVGAGVGPAAHDQRADVRLGV